MSAVRRQEILRRLKASGEVTIAVLATELEVSEMTIRRDLETLDNEGQLRRVRGGAISGREPLLRAAVLGPPARRTEAKQAIGRAAARLVDDGDTVIIDVGTTALEFASHLKGRRGITVVTPSLPVAMELGNESDVRVLVTGGMVRPGEFSLTGGAAEATFADVNCDVAFLGVAGIHAAAGLTEYNPADALVKRAALRAARRCVILADRTKLDHVTFYTIAAVTAVDTLVTDARAGERAVEAIRDAGVEVVAIGPRRPSRPCRACELRVSSVRSVGGHRAGAPESSSLSWGPAATEVAEAALSRSVLSDSVRFLVGS